MSSKRLADIIDNILQELGDEGGVTWLRSEVALAIKEGLQIIDCITYLNRDNVVFTFSKETSFVDLLEISDLEAHIGFSKTKVELKAELDRHLLEDETSTVTIENEVFDRLKYDEIIEKNVVEFLLETGMILKRDEVNFPSPPISSYQLGSEHLNVRRIAVLVDDNYRIVRRETEANARAFFSSGTIESSPYPQFYSLTTSRRNLLRFYPMIDAPSKLETISIKNPIYATSDYLQVVSNLAWVIKYGILYDYYSSAGLGYDVERAKYCKSRWKQGVFIAKNYPLILGGRIAGLPIRFDSVAEFDRYSSNWQNQTATTIDEVSYLRTIGVMSWNLIATSYKLDNSLDIDVDFDILKNTVFPETEDEDVNIPDEFLTHLELYAQHYLLLKLGNEDFYAGIEKLNALFEGIMMENARLNIPGNEIDLIPYKKSQQIRQAPLTSKLVQGEEVTANG